MLSNALNLLLYWTLSRATEHPDAPVFYVHPFRKQLYAITVSRIPEQEAAAA